MATRRRRSPAPTRRAADLIMISRKRGAKPTPLDARTLRTVEAVAQHAREGASLAAALRPLPVGANRSSARGCSLGPRGEPPPLECQGEGYNGALASALSRIPSRTASSPAVDYPQVAMELLDAAAKAAAAETSTEVATEAMDILRPGHGLGPVTSHQAQGEGGSKGEGGGEGGGAAPAGEAGGEEQELHGGDEGEEEGEEEHDVEVEEHELAKALPRARRGGDYWPYAGLTCPSSPPSASRGGDCRGGDLAHNPTHADSRRAPPVRAPRASQPPAQLAHAERRPLSKQQTTTTTTTTTTTHS